MAIATQKCNSPWWWLTEAPFSKALSPLSPLSELLYFLFNSLPLWPSMGYGALSLPNPVGKSSILNAHVCFRSE